MNSNASPPAAIAACTWAPEKFCEQFHAEPPPEWQRGPMDCAHWEYTTCRLSATAWRWAGICYVAAGTGDLA